MNSVSYVDNLITQLKNSGVPLDVVAWKAALACVGWPYVYGAVGEECKPAKRAQYGTKFYPKDHTTIVTKCQAISWDKDSQTCKVTGNCSGCKWNLPVRMFDCRGFTRKILQMVYGWTLMGGTVGGQWNDAKNWKAKGEIKDGIPADTLVCLFVYNSSKKNWQHTGFGFNDETCECSSGVQHFTTRNKKWTHWAVPACEEGDVPVPTPTPTPSKPTLKKGSSGQYVTLLQTELINRGYSCGKSGADGKFGNDTLAAVKAFQKDHGLTADGIVGPKTWAALDNAEPTVYYTVTIPHLTQAAANQLLTNYPGGSMTKE